MPRRTSRIYDSADGLIARAGRAHEDPRKMTSDATLQRIAVHVATALKANPDLTPREAANAARLTIRAEMARVRQGAGEVLNATGLADCGSDGIDA